MEEIKSFESIAKAMEFVNEIGHKFVCGITLAKDGSVSVCYCMD